MKERGSSLMDNLPLDISLDIFSRLSVDTVLKCQRVCKIWRNLLSLDKTNFAAMHLLRHTHHEKMFDNGVYSKVSTQGLIFLIFSKENNINMGKLYYGEYDDTNFNDQCLQNTLRLINHPLQTQGNSVMVSSSLVGSCNGIICLSVPKNGLQDPILICNPVTGEYLHLQGFEENNESFVNKIHGGFGYIPQTKEYKVVRIIYSNGFSREAVQVYTLGAGSGWRNTGVGTPWLVSLHGVYFNGAIHWLGNNGKDIVVFNLSDEKFHVLPTVPLSQYSCQYTSILGSFGEWLCVSDCKCLGVVSMLDIWTYKKIPSEENIAATDNKAESWSWCREFIIRTALDSFAWHYTPFTVIKGRLVLLKYKDPGCPYEQTLFCYDPKTAIMKKLGSWNSFEAIPHINSFISLETLGETTCKKRNKWMG